VAKRSFQTKSIVLALGILFFLLPAFQALAEEELTWEACIKEAALNHPDLIAAQEIVNQSKASEKITASTIFPQVTADLSADRAKSGNGSKPSNSYSYGVNGSQLFFNGLKNLNDVNAAKESIKASQQSYKFTSSEVRLRLRTAFINLLKAQESVKVTEDIVKLRRDNYELITLRYKSGLEHKGAMLTAEANLAEANFGVAQAKRDIELAQRQLTKEIGRTVFGPLSVKADFKVIDAAKEKPDFVTLALNHPSLLQIISQKNAAQFGLKSAYASFSPTLTGNAGANKTGTRWLPQTEEWNMGLTVSVPIFEGGLRLAQVSQADAFLNQLKANERSTKDGIVVTLEADWSALQDAVETVEVQYKQLIAAQERSIIAEAEYSTGFISYDNWTIIEDNLVSSKTRYLDAEANALLTEANWIQAKGETLEYAQ
jgi:outer membrane protein TolC